MGPAFTPAFADETFWSLQLFLFKMMFGVGAGVLDIIGDIDMGVSRDELDIGISLDDTAGLDSAGIMITSDNNND